MPSNPAGPAASRPAYSPAQAPKASGPLWRWLPARCEVCGRWPSAPAGQAVCATCLADCLPPRLRCPRCALAHAESPSAPGTGSTLPQEPPPCLACQNNPPPLARCIAALDYGYPWHTLIQRFKFNGEVAWAGLLAQLLWQTPHVPTTMAACDWWLPLPLSARRLGERGYNQSWELLKHLAALHPKTPTPARHQADWLLKIGDTADQHALGRAERLRNLGSVFSVAPHALPHLAGRDVLLVDDVMTTGATLHAAGLALRRAGVRSVSALVLARTPAPEPLSPQ